MVYDEHANPAKITHDCALVDSVQLGDRHLVAMPHGLSNDRLSLERRGEGLRAIVSDRLR